MVKAKLTDEEKEAQYEKWMGEPEALSIGKFQVQRKTIPNMELANKDLCFNYQPFFDSLFEMVQELKVPGRKAKAYEQQFIRTMFFEKCEHFTIDGTMYNLTNAAQVELWTCKSAIVDIFNFLDDFTVGDARTPDTYQGWKKELIKLLKDWDKHYVKHSGSKGTSGEMNTLHTSAMKPLTELIDSNLNFYNLEQMVIKGNNGIAVPDFRRDALEEQFCVKLTKVCDIFKEYGTEAKLEDHFDIKQMLKMQKIPDWQVIKPFWYFVTPLNNSITKVRKDLLKMHSDGVLMIKYIVEENQELKKDVIDMVKNDVITQWLMGDDSKQDQFNFLYEVIKIAYDSAVRDKLIALDKDLVEEILPQLVAFKSIMAIRNIQLKKAQEAAHEKEKTEKLGETNPVAKKLTMGKMTEDQIVAQRMENEKTGAHIEKSEHQKEQEAEEKDRKAYGRFWIWDGYFNERNKESWLETAEDLKNVNDMVIQDIEDSILLQAFKGQKPSQIQMVIDNDHQERILNQKKLLGKDGEKYEEEQKLENKKRKFMEGLRPPLYWNFFEDGNSSTKVKHVLRSQADPTKAYTDGRIEKIVGSIQNIGKNLSSHEEVKWRRLMKYALSIFEQEFITLKKNLEKA